MILILAGSKNEMPASVFPPKIERIIKRKAPRNAREFPEYVSQLERDAAAFRVHFDNLVARYPSVAEGVRKFKSELLSAKLEPPLDYKVEPNRVITEAVC